MKTGLPKLLKITPAKNGFTVEHHFADPRSTKTFVFPGLNALGSHLTHTLRNAWMKPGKI